MKALKDQVIFVTGATDGIGKQTARDLAGIGATVLLHGRNEKRGKQVVQTIREATGSSKIAYYHADFAALDEVRRLAEEIQATYSALDVLINNAGVGAGKTGDAREVSRDGYELRFAVNYLAPFLLTHLLVPALRQAAPARIINVSSIGQQPIDFDNVMLEREYDPLRAYRQSKLAQIMFTIDLAEQLKGDNITVNCLHPGTLLDTKMVRETFGTPRGSVHEGADALVYQATADELTGKTGLYFDQQTEAEANAQAYDKQARDQLWRLSEHLTGLSADSPGASETSEP